ncbi:TPA: hypothetical protein L4W69_005441 [Pseudomonas aeruginosa]|nr:hypothetical protein [Pseudomonas aeruginosa]
MMRLNLDNAVSTYSNLTHIQGVGQHDTDRGQIGVHPPVSGSANGKTLEDQLDQLKELASDDRVAPMFEEGALATLEKLMIMLREMQAKTRDMWREFAANQQQAAHTMRITAYETRLESIEQNYNAAMTQGFSQILSGIVNVSGAMTGNQLVTMGTSGFGKTSEGFGTMISASQTREAQVNQAIAEFQQGSSEEFRKTLDAAVDKASEASRQMREWLKELGELQSRIMSAVRL